MADQPLTSYWTSAVLGQLPARLMRTGRRLRRPLAATSAAGAATTDFFGGLLIFAGVLMQIAADVSPAAARRSEAA